MGELRFDYLIKTNISNKFMDEKADDNFCRWLLDKHSNQFSLTLSSYVNIENTPVSKVFAYINTLTNDHDIDLRIYVTTTDDRKNPWDFDDLYDNDEFMDWLEDTFIIEFINKFNESCNIQFPIDRDGFTDVVTYYDDSFYIKSFLGQDGYTTFRVYTETFALTDDITENF